MSRVSTSGNYGNVLSNIMAAQQRQIEAGVAVATRKKGSDLKDFSRSAELLTAMRSVDTRLGGYLQQNTMIADKLTNQDFALNQVGDATASTKQAIEEAIATGRTDTLMQEIEAQFRNTVSGMNARYAGKYLFAGGKIDTQPVTAQGMSDLTTGTPIADLFQNDDFITEHKVDDSTTVKTGMLANNIGTDLMEAYKTIQEFHEATPFGGVLTEDQKTFLEGVLNTWTDLHSDVIDKTARNGMTQARVESVKTDLTSRQNSLAGMIGEITDADMAEAASALEQATLSLQASTQVFLALKESSLLNVLQ